MLYGNEYCSPVGKMRIVCDETALIGLWLKGQKYFSVGIREPVLQQETEILLRTKMWLDEYFRGKIPDDLKIPMNPQGTVFQKRVWQLVREIPYGAVCTYGQLAQRLARDTGAGKMSAQTVGGAVGRNPILILIPCHRVIGADGTLTGYAGGVETKKWLLRQEGVDIR